MTTMQIRLNMETERELTPWEMANRKVEQTSPWDWKHYDNAYNNIRVDDLFKPDW